MQTNRIFESKLCVLEKKKTKVPIRPSKDEGIGGGYGEEEEGANNGS